MIPLISGNLSVDYMLRRMRGDTPPSAGTHAAELDEMLGLGVSGVEDYIGWAAVECRPDEWDFRFHQENQRQCRERGMQYIAYPWFHVLPEWRRQAGFVGFRCLEHDKECAWPSIFAPNTLVLAEQFYAVLADQLSDGVDAICVGFPADYGEVGYPTGWADWVAPLPPPRDHAHPGFWLADVHAQEQLNWFWSKEGRGESLETVLAGAGSASSRILFADFVLDSMVDFVDALLRVVRGHFPKTPLSIKVGHGGEPLHYGIDPARLARCLAPHGAALRSTQATLPVVHQKRLATACRVFGVPWSTEPPCHAGRETVLERLLEDAAGGATEAFYFRDQLIAGQDLMQRHLQDVGQGPSEVDVGVFFADRDLHAAATMGFPPVLYELADVFRDRFDFALMDEVMIEHDALQSLEVLVIPEARHVTDATQDRILAFARNGGTVVAGPDTSDWSGPLAEALATAPDASGFLRMEVNCLSSVALDLGRRPDRLFLTGHWHHPEDASQFRGSPPEGEACRWTGAQAAALLPVVPGRRHLLELECWVHPHAHHLRREIRVNGTALGRLTQHGLQRFAAWASPEMLGTESLVRVEFDCEPMCLHDLGLGEDQRVLGLAVLWIRLTEEGCQPVTVAAAPEWQVHGQLQDAFWTDAVQACGQGHLVAVREAALSSLLEVVHETVRRRSNVHQEVQRIAGSEPAPGVRTALFPNRLSLFNATRDTVMVVQRPLNSGELMSCQRLAQEPA